MDPRKNIYRFIKLVVLSVLIVVTFSLTDWHKENGKKFSRGSNPLFSDRSNFPISKLAYITPLLIAEAENGLEFLKDFRLVPGRVAVIEERYVMALLENAEKGLYAIIMFTADCGPGGCTIGDLVAYSLFDAQGVESQLVNNFQQDRPAAPESYLKGNPFKKDYSEYLAKQKLL
ncbi:MAG: hypothetical protein ACREQA_00115 [Candidatus Binatia bacterium]